MRVFVKVKPKAKEEKIEKLDESHFIIKIKAAPEKDKANQELIKLLSEYFNQRVKIISGERSREKIVEIY